MTSTNLQVRLPLMLAKLLDQVASSSKAEFVREAIQEKIARAQAYAKEQRWIRALAKAPDTAADDAWLVADVWEDA